MDLRQLRYFASVAREGSFLKAAGKLNVAQPALSRHIQSLEQEIGVELFIRTPRGVEMTESGRRLMEKADFVLRFVSEIKSGINQLATEPSGEVVLGLSPSFAPLIAHSLLDEAKRRFPLVKLRIVEALSVVLYDWLEQSRVDLALVTDFGQAAGIKTVEIAKDEIVFIGTADKLGDYADGDTMPLADIVRFPLVITQGFHQLLAGRLREENVEPNYEMEISSTPIVTDIVRRGSHCSIVGSSFVHEEVKQGKLRALRFMGPPIWRHIVLASRLNRPPSLAREAVSLLTVDQVCRLGVKMTDDRPDGPMSKVEYEAGEASDSPQR